jgi:uncharacterized protein YjbJ (UPF0337 family)
MERANEGRMQQLKGRLKGVWGEITDDDVDRSEGDMDRLIGIVKEKTGEGEVSIRERLNQLMGDGEQKSGN